MGTGKWISAPNGTKTHYKAEEQLGVNLFPGRHEAIISSEERAAIQRKRGAKSSHPGPANTTLKNPFAGLCFCSDCGRMMVRSLGRHGEPRLWCKEYHCSTGTVGEKKVEALLLRTLRERLVELEIPVQRCSRSRHRGSPPGKGRGIGTERAGIGAETAGACL